MLNELIKLTTLWTTGPRKYVDKIREIDTLEDFNHYFSKRDNFFWKKFNQSYKYMHKVCYFFFQFFQMKFYMVS